MAITVNSVTGLECWDSFRKGRDFSGPYVDLAYLIPFAQADAFVDGCMGGVVASGGPGGGITNVPKLRCPTNNKLFAMNASYVGVGEDYGGSAGGRPVFSRALVTVHFAIPTWPQFLSDDPGGQQAFPNEVLPEQPYIFAECEIDLGGEAIEIPNTSLVYASDSAAVGHGVTKWVGNATFRMIRHYFPYLPTTLVATKLNKINDATFLGRDRGTVRFAGAKTRQVQTSDGTRTQMWELIFEWREKDWNYYPRDNSYTWDKVVSKTDSTVAIYEYADLKPLVS